VECTACAADTYKSVTGSESKSVCGSFAVHSRTGVTFSGGLTTLYGGDVGVSPGTVLTGEVGFDGGGSIVDGSSVFAASVLEAHTAAMAVNPEMLPRNVERENLNLKPSTSKPQPETLNFQTQIPNPNPRFAATVARKR